MSAKQRRVVFFLFIPAVLLSSFGCQKQPEHPSTSFRKIQKQVKEVLETMPEAPDTGTQAEEVARLERLGDEAILPLERYLDSLSDSKRLIALLALQRLNDKRSGSDFSEEDIDWCLSAIAQSRNVLVRTYAMESLIRSGRRFMNKIERFQKTADPAVAQKLDIVLNEIRS